MPTETKSSQANTTSAARNLRGALAIEFLGTYQLTLIPLLPATAMSRIAGVDPIVSMFVIAVSFGLVLFFLVLKYAERSGANFNPAITFGLWRQKQLRTNVAIMYMIAQFLGGIVASLTLWLIFIGQPVEGFGVTKPIDGVSAVAAGVVELGFTTIFVATVVTLADSKMPPAVVAGGVGGCLAVLVFAGEFFSGGAYNPARALGPMILNGQMQYAWYVIPEFIGGWLGAKIALGPIRDVTPPEPPTPAAKADEGSSNE